jgi:hypothetical protein
MSVVRIISGSKEKIASLAAIWELGDEHPYFGPLYFPLHHYFPNRLCYLNVYFIEIIIVQSLDDVRTVLFG